MTVFGHFEGEEEENFFSFFFDPTCDGSLESEKKNIFFFLVSDFFFFEKKNFPQGREGEKDLVKFTFLRKMTVMGHFEAFFVITY